MDRARRFFAAGSAEGTLHLRHSEPVVVAASAALAAAGVMTLARRLLYPAASPEDARRDDDKLAAAVAAGSLLCLAPHAAADENAFGPASQDLWIPAQAFAGMNPLVAQRYVFFGDKYAVVAPPRARARASSPPR